MTQQHSLGQGQNDAFYNGTKWRKESDWKLKRNSMCEHCLAKGIYHAAELVDHIIEIEDNWDLRYVRSNYQSLCKPCHNRKTAKARKERLSGKLLTPSDIINWAINKNKKGNV
ncbi:5-methylcytosine-specific restriction endonuclease McrA [Aeromonas hydrophila]|uniref:HNH endonuclease signature motif containing protein n=1 Tax=Aeromonas hydrophila TaxID=644 RepID=UPI002168B6B8|nr:HNH endonuclease signature motif containing protein [Aeromonas hydrophila]MCS3766150.1 5-methylcytosine-specific restriction endonuclease McrA [Aeromonas hydrophila]